MFRSVMHESHLLRRVAGWNIFVPTLVIESVLSALLTANKRLPLPLLASPRQHIAAPSVSLHFTPTNKKTGLYLIHPRITYTYVIKSL